MKKKLSMGAGTAVLAAGLAIPALAAGGMGGNTPTNAPTAAPPPTAYPTARPMTQGTTTQTPLSQVSDVNTLNSASVQDKDGNSVGSVHKVITGAGGKPSQVQVKAGSVLGMGSKVVTIDASRIKYERDRNVLITNLTRDEIKALPAAQGT